MASFEEAIFRVYDRSMESMHEEDDDAAGQGSGSQGKVCRWFQYTAFGLASFMGLCVLILHFSFVGQSGCLPQLLHERMLQENRTELLPSDAILQINVDKAFRQDTEEFGDDDLLSGEERRRTLSSDSWEEFDITSSSSSSFSMEPRYSNVNARYEVDNHDNHLNRKKQNLGGNEFQDMLRGIDTENGGAFKKTILGRVYTGVTNTLSSLHRGLSTSSSTASSSNHTAPAKFNTTGSVNFTAAHAKYFVPWDYEFSFDIAVLSLSDEIRAKHEFQLINITMDRSCFGGNGLVQGLLPLGGVDTVLTNDLMYSLRKGGMLTTYRSDFYIWRITDIIPYTTFGGWLGFKVAMGLKISFIFLLLSHTTALLVRILISSGVVLLFPMFYLLRCCGFNHAQHHMRILSHAYPWLGLPMEIYTSRGLTQIPFLIGHLSRVVIYYTLYEALQFASALWFYDNAQPGQKELWLFAMMMVWEYFSMIYVRAASSIQLFPRVCFTSFAIYHIYLYSFPAGFHMLALFACSAAVLGAMALCVRKYETEAYNRGLVNSEQPRMYSNAISWPVWNTALAPDFTLFMPVSQVSNTVYANAVAPLPGTENTENTENNGTSIGAAGAVGAGHMGGGVVDEDEESETAYEMPQWLVNLVGGHRPDLGVGVGTAQGQQAGAGGRGDSDTGLSTGMASTGAGVGVGVGIGVGMGDRELQMIVSASASASSGTSTSTTHSITNTGSEGGAYERLETGSRHDN